MQIIEFPEFSRRRRARGGTDAPTDFGPALPIADRWAGLHSAEPERRNEPAEDTVDFWSDLSFRLAYPTHRMRSH